MLEWAKDQSTAVGKRTKTRLAQEWEQMKSNRMKNQRSLLGDEGSLTPAPAPRAPEPSASTWMRNMGSLSDDLDPLLVLEAFASSFFLHRLALLLPERLGEAWAW